MRQQSLQKNSGNLCHVSHLLINKHFSKTGRKNIENNVYFGSTFQLKNQGDQCSKGIFNVSI